MILEKDFEEILCKYPDLIEDNLQFKGKQVHLYGRRMDIVFEDKFNRTLIVAKKPLPKAGDEANPRANTAVSARTSEARENNL